MNIDKIRLAIAYKNRRENEHHTPPEKARSTLKALVLFSTLASDFKALSIPIMIARIKTSPAELIANEIFETRLSAKDSKLKCASKLYHGVSRWAEYIQESADGFDPFFACSAEA